MQRNHRPHGPSWLDRPLSFEEVKEHRHVSCGLYGICLEVAARRGWRSFSCRPCSLWPQGGGQKSQGPARVLAMARKAQTL